MLTQDKDGNGAISIEELREGLTTVMGSEADPDAAVNIMAALDVSGTNHVHGFFLGCVLFSSLMI